MTPIAAIETAPQTCFSSSAKSGVSISPAGYKPLINLPNTEASHSQK